MGAYIRSSIKYSTLDYDVLHAECLWFDMNINGCRLIVGIIYRKPNTDISEFQDSLLAVLQSIKIDKLQCILLGDFNINLLVTDNKVEQFQSGLQCMGMQQLIKSPTRVTKYSSSLIDHIYTNLVASEIHAGVIETDVSDHFPIFVAFEDDSWTNKASCKGKHTFRSFKSYDVKVMMLKL